MNKTETGEIRRVYVRARTYPPATMPLHCRNEMMNMNTIAKRILSITLLTLLVTCAAADDIDPDADVGVTVNAPEYVSEDTFEVTIDVTEVSGIIGAQFDLTFDPDVINIDNTKTDVESGMIDDMELPISSCRLFDDGRIRVIIFNFNLIEEGGISGSGYVAKITFAVVGATGDASAIEFYESDESTKKLTDAEREVIPANWFGTNVTLGTAPSMPAETPTPTESPTIAAAPEPTATPIETPSLELASNPTILTASAQGAPAAAVPAASSEKDGLQDILTEHNFIAIYSLVGLLAFIYSLTLFR